MYVVKVLEDKQFNNLPFKYVKEALGCADPKTNTAYVRKTHWGEVSKTVDLLTIQHELDELVAKTSPHEVDGIRYKRGGSIIRNVASAISVITGHPYIAAAMQAGHGAYEQSKGRQTTGQTILGTAGALGAGALGAGAGGGAAYTAAREAGKGIIPSLGQSLQYATGIGAGGTVLGQGTAAGASTMGTPSAVMGTSVPGYDPSSVLSTATFPASTIGTAPGVSGAIGPTGGTAVSGYEGVSSLLSKGISGVGIGVSPGFTQATGEAIKTTGGTLKDLANPMSMMGLGTMSMAALPTGATPPNIGDIAAKWLTADTVTKAGEEAKKIADIEYGGEFQPSKEIQAFIKVQEKDIRKAYDQRRKDMDRMGLAMSEQFMNSGERLEMHRRLQEEEQTEVDRMQANWLVNAKQEHATKQYNYVMEQMRADEVTKRDLLYANIADVTWKYNMKQEDVMNFRKIASDAGMYMLSKGMGIT